MGYGILRVECGTIQDMTDSREVTLQQMLDEAKSRPGVAEAVRIYTMAQRSASPAMGTMAIFAPVMRTSTNVAR